MATGVCIWMAGAVFATAQIQAGPGSACVGCHMAQTAHQAQTPMGQAMLLPGFNSTLKARPKLFLRKFPYTYTIETKGDQSTYTVSNGTQKISLPIMWTFGKRMQTWILERNGRYYESLRHREVTDCFGCHS